MTVKVIQHMRPHGRPVEQFTKISDDCAADYEAMLKAGCWLTAEVLSTGEISLTISNQDGDFSGELAKNGPEVQRAIEKLLRNFKQDYEAWKKQNDNTIEGITQL